MSISGTSLQVCLYSDIILCSPTGRITANIVLFIIKWIQHKDTIYNLVAPHVQPSTQRLATILLHHVAAGVLVLHPLQYPEAHGYLTAYATIVEVNTLFHSLSKKFKAQKAFVHAFHATWIGLRLGWYPYLLAVVFPRVMQGYSDRVYWQVVGSQAVLVALNLLWTAEVVYGLLRPKKRKAP